MANSHALVDLTLDSGDEDGNRAGSNAIQKARKGLSTRKDRTPESLVGLIYSMLLREL